MAHAEESNQSPSEPLDDPSRTRPMAKGFFGAATPGWALCLGVMAGCASSRVSLTQPPTSLSRIIH